MSGLAVREATAADRDAIRAVEEAAFGREDEALLVEALAASGGVVLELVAEAQGRIVGHILFSRLTVARPRGDVPAVALAPLAVAPGARRQGIGAALVEEAHRRLRTAGERLSVVLGDPAYYGRFGYARAAAAGFDSDYQGEALQALDWGGAPADGRLVYAPAFSGL